MGCLYLLVALISPRLLLGGLWFFTGYVRPGAFQSFLWPLLGLIFMPWLTLGLVWGGNVGFGPLQIAACVIGGIMDVTAHSDAERRRRRANRNSN
ncbi:MAG: hypothetical protein IPP14_04405 [Planctomycetes bacterium]|nr:hypothetical protein [Planctomycetota bacterium]